MINIQDEPRQELEVIFECHAPDILFADDWKDLSEEAQEYYQENHLPCEGTGNMHLYCAGCPFGCWGIL